MDLERIQHHLRDAGLDGWLFYDFRQSDPLALRVLGIPADMHTTRRWFYYLPAQGQPTKIVHRIEAGVLDRLPGEKLVYLRWEELHQALQRTLSNARRIAMQYSPMCAIPYISRVDAGTVELVRSLIPGIEVVSSGDLIQQFEATCTPEQYESHCAAADLLGRLVQETFAEVARRVQQRGETSEYEIQRFVVEWFERENLVTDHPPIVAVTANAANPHYFPTKDRSKPIRKGDLLLLDVWARLNRPESIFADITWMAMVDSTVPEEFSDAFRAVARARDAAVAFIRDRLSQGQPVRGFEADQVARHVIEEAGYGEYFIHRTGHSIHTTTHGNGANLDSLETMDERVLLNRTCFSVEPGIYIPGKFGVRSEIDVFLWDGEVRVTGPEPQQEIQTIL